MNILIFEFNGGVLNSADIRHALKKKNISFHTVSYCFRDTAHDEFFVKRFSRVLAEGSYDAVFSINYFPLVARCCCKAGVKYLAWSFDCPLNADNVEETLALETNYVFLFDREHTRQYKRQGFSNVYHLPLAVNCDRLDMIKPTKQEAEHYGADVSFVGKFYESDLPKFREAMSEYDRGYVDAVCAAQTDLYGCFLPDICDPDAFIERVNAHYAKTMPGAGVRIHREWLFYELSKVVTRRERVRLMKLMGDSFDTKLYSIECPDILSSVTYMGTCDYLTGMPTVFKTSRINLHTTLRCIRTGISQRVVDILGAGGFCLANYQEEILEHFENGVDLVIYDNVFDAVEKAGYYLSHPDEAEAIRRSGYQKAREYFSYEDRLEYIFRTAGLI